MYGIWKYFAVLALLLIVPASFSISISEIMYNPEGTDTDREWVEIYNNDTQAYDITGWKLNTKGVNHNLNVPPAGGGIGDMIFSPGEYIIIAQDAPIFISAQGPISTVIDSSWYPDLSNSANEMIWLADGAFIYANMTYYPNVAEGNTVCMTNGGYYECVPTPGAANEIYVHDTSPPAVFAFHTPADPVANQTVVINATADDDRGLDAIEIFVDNNHAKTCYVSGLSSTCSYSTHALPIGVHTYYASANDTSENPGTSAISTITIIANVTNTTQSGNTTNQTDECDMYVNINTDSVVYDTDNAIGFDIFINDSSCSGIMHNVSIEYFIEDVFGNIAKALLNDTDDLACFSTMNKQWTPHDVSGSEAYYIKAAILNATCNDTNMLNNNATTLIVVKGNYSSPANSTETPPDTISAINITSVNIGSDNEVKYGEAADIRLTIYRGNTSKYAIDVWIDSGGTKLSEISTIHAGSKFTEYKFQIPLQLKTNCDNSYNNGTYTIIAEGLDTNSTLGINISGISTSTCKIVTVSSACPTCSCSSSSGSSSCSSGSTTSLPTTPYDIINYTLMAEVEKEFTTTVKISNNFTKSKNFTVYSYVFKGNEPMSLGFNDNASKWEATYVANSKTISLTPLSSVMMKLKNKIEDGTETGIYSLRVRIKVDGKENDITKDIVVIESNSKNAQAPVPVVIEAKGIEQNVTENNAINNIIDDGNLTKNNDGNLITGLAVQNSFGLFSSPLISLLRMFFGF